MLNGWQGRRNAPLIQGSSPSFIGFQLGSWSLAALENQTVSRDVKGQASAVENPRSHQPGEGCLFRTRCLMPSRWSCNQCFHPNASNTKCSQGGRVGGDSLTPSSPSLLYPPSQCPHHIRELPSLAERAPKSCANPATQRHHPATQAALAGPDALASRFREHPTGGPARLAAHRRLLPAPGPRPRPAAATPTFEVLGVAPRRPVRISARHRRDTGRAVTHGIWL